MLTGKPVLLNKILSHFAGFAGLRVSVRRLVDCWRNIPITPAMLDSRFMVSSWPTPKRAYHYCSNF